MHTQKTGKTTNCSGPPSLSSIDVQIETMYERTQNVKLVGKKSN